MQRSKQFSIRVDGETARKLEKVARSLGRHRSWFVGEALKRYLEVEHAQMEAIKEGMAAAERGEFVAEGEKEWIFGKYRAAVGD